MSKRSERWREEKRCRQCGKQDENTLKGRCRCRTCTIKARKYNSYKKLSDEAKAAVNHSAKEWRKALYEHHLCRICKTQDAYTLAGRVYCAECAAINAEKARKTRKTDKRKAYDHDYQKKRAQKLKAAGICTTCGKRKPEDGYFNCKWCRAKLAKRKRDRRIRQGINYPRGEHGYCWQCNRRPVMNGKSLCTECYEAKVKLLNANKEKAKSVSHVWSATNNMFFPKNIRNKMGRDITW